MERLNRGNLLTPKTASERFGIPRRKIYQWVRNKRFPYIKPGRELLIWEADFISFLEANTVPSYDGYSNTEGWE